MTGYRFLSSGRYLPDSSELLDLHLIGQSVDFRHINRRAPLGAEKKPSSQRKTAQCFKLSEFYLRIAKTATPTQVRTALNSNEKSTLRLKSNSQLRHNCPNTMRKQASDGVNCFIASLLCRATAPLLTLEPFFFYRTPSIGEDRMAVGLPTKRPN